MQAKRKSTNFLGDEVPLESIRGDVLYPRYNEPSQLVQKLVGLPDEAKGGGKKRKNSKSAPNESPSGTVPTKKPETSPTIAEQEPSAVVERAAKVRKKARWSEERKDVARQERETKRKPAAGHGATLEVDAAKDPAEDAANHDESKKKKKEILQLVKLAPEERVSGPSNAAEAMRIRESLGFSGPKVADTSGTGSFHFDFNDNTMAAAVVEPIKSKIGPNAVADATGGTESSSDSESSDSDSDASDSSTSSSEFDNNSDDAPSGGRQKEKQTLANATAGAASSAPPEHGDYIERRVYVGGMPYGYSEAQVHEFWEYCGAIESLDLLTFPDTGRFRGIAFITFATEEGYQAALACDGEPCEGQTVKVQKCKRSAKDAARANPGKLAQRTNEPSSAITDRKNHSTPHANDDALRAPAPKTSGYDVAYVGNIAWEADEAALKAMFEPYGVTKVRLHTDQDTGKPKGYAHVHFKDETSLDAAMTLNGAMLMGRRIRVGYAQPKKEEGSGKGM